MAEEVSDDGKSGDLFADRPRITRGDDQIDVGDGITKAAEAPTDSHVRDLLERGNRLDQSDGNRQGFGDREPDVFAAQPQPVDRLGDLLFLGWAESGELAQKLLIESCLESLQILDTEFVTQPSGRLGPDPRHLRQPDELRRVVGAEGLQLRRGSCGDVLMDLGGGALADSGESHQFLLRHRGDIAGDALYRPACVLICAYPKRLRVTFVEDRQGGQLVQ